MAQDEFDKQTMDMFGVDMDIIDQAQQKEERIMDMQIQAIRSAPRELQPIGMCHDCLSPVEGQKLFCDSQCATYYEKRKK